MSDYSKKRNPQQMYRINGNNTFVEFMGGMLDKGRVGVTFVEYDPENGNKTKVRIDTYVKAPLFGGFIEGLLSGEFRKSIEIAKQTGFFDGKKIGAYTSFFTAMGGKNEAAVKKNLKELQAQYTWLQDGMAISRQLKVQESTKYAYMFRGEIGVGKSDTKGLIVPQGNYKAYIQIPAPSQEIMAMAWACKNYMAAFENQRMYKMAENLWKNQMNEFNFSFVNPGIKAPPVKSSSVPIKAPPVKTTPPIPSSTFEDEDDGEVLDELPF